jgi:pimeloyl-ACP methyl ester carboxylesterase
MLSVPADPRPLAYSRTGSGEPLLLIHGNGMSRAAWSPVLALLRSHRDVIAVDLPGHGASPPMPSHLTPAPPGFARVLAELLAELGIERAHVAGNSLGGWTALELAKLGRARSVCALGPAGLWERGPILPMIRLGLPHLAARRWPGLAEQAMRAGSTRGILLRHAFGHPDRVPVGDAGRMAADLARASGFIPTLLATHSARFTGGQGIAVPVTIVFGRLDRVVPRNARRRDQLPADTRWLDLADVGHVPMWDDPRAVAEAIAGTSPTRP